MILDTKQAILTRRSVRSFVKRTVPPDMIAEILDSASKAPSASNGRPWEFVIVKDQKIKERIGYLGARSLYERKKRKLKLAKEKFLLIADAPVYIVVACDTKKSPIFWVHDGSAATQNILLAAHSMGLGAVWLGAPVALTKHQNEIKKMLNMPRHVKIASIVALGYPKKVPQPRASSNMKEKVHFERW
jgi:nitroreductase